MAKIIQVSFKEGEEYLYDEICKHSCKSSFIKECVMKCIEQPQQENKKPLQGAKGASELTNILNSL